MEKCYELKPEKELFLIELWCRYHGVELDKVETFPQEEIAQRLKEAGL